MGLAVPKCPHCGGKVPPRPKSAMQLMLEQWRAERREYGTVWAAASAEFAADKRED